LRSAAVGLHAMLLRRCRGGGGRLLRERLATAGGELPEEHHRGDPEDGHVERQHEPCPAAGGGGDVVDGLAAEKRALIVAVIG
jgi:hypothetical protein